MLFILEFSSPYTARCLLNPCQSNQWCEDDRSKSSNVTCIEPAGFYCSFNSGYCQWRNASIEDHHWKTLSKYGSLRHDHTDNVCGGEDLTYCKCSQPSLWFVLISQYHINKSTPFLVFLYLVVVFRLCVFFLDSRKISRLSFPRSTPQWSHK